MRTKKHQIALEDPTIADPPTALILIYLFIFNMLPDTYRSNSLVLAELFPREQRGKAVVPYSLTLDEREAMSAPGRTRSRKS